jgi:hypothetical protein
LAAVAATAAGLACSHAEIKLMAPCNVLLVSFNLVLQMSVRCVTAQAVSWSCGCFWPAVQLVCLLSAACCCCLLLPQVKMHLKGKTTHHEQQQQKKQEEKAAAKAAKSSKSEAAANGLAPDGADAIAAAAGEGASSSAGDAQAGAGQQLLVCGSCGEQAQGLEAAKAHAAATGHTDFEEVVAI